MGHGILPETTVGKHNPPCHLQMPNKALSCKKEALCEHGPEAPSCHGRPSSVLSAFISKSSISDGRGVHKCIRMGSLHVLGGTMNAEKYIKVLEQHMLPSRRCLLQWRPCVFQQDNAKLHTAAITTAWLRSRRVLVPNWPACSPDVLKIRGDATPWWTYPRSNYFETCCRHYIWNELILCIKLHNFSVCSLLWKRGPSARMDWHTAGLGAYANMRFSQWAFSHRHCAKSGRTRSRPSWWCRTGPIWLGSPKLMLFLTNSSEDRSPFSKRGHPLAPPGWDTEVLGWLTLVVVNTILLEPHLQDRLTGSKPLFCKIGLSKGCLPPPSKNMLPQHDAVDGKSVGEQVKSSAPSSAL